MADGSSGGLSGVLFEAGKTISDAGKKQAQATANAVAGQVSGNAKPLFGGQKSTSGSFTPKPAGSGQQMPKLDPFGDFGKMFEGGKASTMGAKQPPLPPIQQYTQADLDAMAAQNSVTDQQKITEYEAELAQLKQKHKGLHDEVYYNKIKNIGENSIAQERQEKAQQEQQEEEAKQQAQAQQQEVLPGSPLAANQQLGTPVAVQQAKTQTEINRGTTG